MYKRQVIDLESSKDAKTWTALTPKELPSGPQRVRFKLKKQYPDDALLLLSGLGAKDIWIKFGEKAQWQKHKAHAYREKILKLSEYDYNTQDYFYLLLPRKNTTYIDQINHPLRKEIPILFERPRIFSPLHVVITKK